MYVGISSHPAEGRGCDVEKNPQNWGAQKEKYLKITIWE